VYPFWFRLRRVRKSECKQQIAGERLKTLLTPASYIPYLGWHILRLGGDVRRFAGLGLPIRLRVASREMAAASGRDLLPDPLVDRIKQSATTNMIVDGWMLGLSTLLNLIGSRACDDPPSSRSCCKELEQGSQVNRRPFGRPIALGGLMNERVAYRNRCPEKGQFRLHRKPIWFLTSSQHSHANVLESLQILSDESSVPRKREVVGSLHIH